MRRSDSAAPRGTSISHPTPLPVAPPGAEPPAWAPGAGGLRRTPAAPRDDRRATVLTLPVGRRRPAAPEPRTGPRGRLLAAVLHIDRRLTAGFRECGRDPRVADAVRVLGLTGEHAAVWMAAGAAGALADAERRRAWLRATAAVAAAHLASMGVKRLVRRPRPRIPGAAPLVPTAGRLSFPSSHASSSAAAVVAFGALLPGAATVPVLAAAICVSRLVAGVHYPTDVACGALLGAATAGLGRGWTLAALPSASAARYVLPGAGVAARGAGAGAVGALAARVLAGAVSARGGGSRG